MDARPHEEQEIARAVSIAVTAAAIASVGGCVAISTAAIAALSEVPPGLSSRLTWSNVFLLI
jgi:hypothetical protein